MGWDEWSFNDSVGSSAFGLKVIFIAECSNVRYGQEAGLHAMRIGCLLSAKVADAINSTEGGNSLGPLSLQ